MSEDSIKRIAIVGFTLESNAFAPVTTREDFFRSGFYTGKEMLEKSFVKPLFDPQGEGFGPVMTNYCKWEPVPILFSTAGAGGPCDHDFFQEVVSEMVSRIQAGGPLDGVYIVGHGAGITTEVDDLDGAYFSAIREIVGPEVPVIATLDLHGNISEQMVASTDLLISFLTNPHVDMVERSAEAAHLMHEMFEGMQPVTSFVRLPLVTPQVTQLTGAGHPYGDLINHGQQKKTAEIANVSILSGFTFSDTKHNGLAILVTARTSQEAADEFAQELADYAWRDRHRYVPDLISIEAGVALAVEAGVNSDLPPIILADVADNPGGGGRGNTTWLLESLHTANAKGVFYGVFFAPDVVEHAYAQGINGTFLAKFNEDEPSEYSLPFSAEAKVVDLSEGRFLGKVGMTKDVPMKLGRCCLLQLGGISLVVISNRQQIFSDEPFELLGLDSRAARTFVVKSRGHFRAGFSHLIDESNIYDVDAPGLATPNLQSLTWRGLPRPIHPLDEGTQWP